MNAKRKFYVDQLKRILPMTAIVLVFFLVFHFIEISSSDYNWPKYGYLVVRYVSPTISFLTYLGASYALLLPIYLFSYRHSRQKEDLLYSLPMRRRTLAFLEYLVGLTSVLICFTIPYLFGILMRLSVPHYALFFGNFFSYLPVAWILLVLVYSMGSVFSLVSRSVLENIFVLLFSQLFFLLLSLLIDDSIKGSFLSFVPLTGISYVTLIFDTLIGHSYQGVMASAAPVDGPILDLGIRPANYDNWTFLGAFVFLVVLAFLIVPALLFLVERQKSEETGRASKSWLGLRLVLPLTFVMAMACFGSSIGYGLAYAEYLDSSYHESLMTIGVLLSALAYLLLDMLRRKKIGFTWDSLVFLLVGLVVLSISLLVSRQVNLASFSDLNQIA